MHSANILDIQQETLRILNNTQEVLTDLQNSEVVATDSSIQKQTIEAGNLKNIESIIKNESQKATNMEMVVAVVGTMKSGKSTTINAIVGQEILPNRALPMTALPTLVTHKKGCLTPVLTFPHPEPLIDLSTQIANKLKTKDISSGYAFLGSDDGKALVEVLIQAGKLVINQKYNGQKEIFEFLHKLNDLMRAAKELNISPPYEEYDAIDSLPRIEVEFFHLKNNEDSDHGRLSILDTPGPNEYGQSEALKKVFRKQLAQASAVLLVMDYTQLNSEADGTVREEIASMQDSLGDRLFALVNKFDNASKNTMDADATKKYVSEHLLKKMPSERIFPVSSWWAYLANRALNELDHQGKINEDNDWVKDFGEEALGRLWKNKITDNKEVKDVSLALWEDSNFAIPLKQVITEAHAKVAFDSLDSTLNKLTVTINELDKGVNGRLSGLKSDIKLLKQMTDDLHNDQQKLDKVEKKIDEEVRKVLRSTQEEIKTIINKNIVQAEKTTQTFLKTGKIDNKNKKKKRETDNNKMALKEEKRNKQQHRSGEDDTEKALSSSENEISYDDPEEVKKLLTLITKEIKDISDGLLEECEKIVSEKINSLQENLKNNTERTLKSVLNKAQKRLKDQGVIVIFKFPQFNSKTDVQFSIDELLSGSIDTCKKRKTRKRKGLWNSFKYKFEIFDYGLESYTSEDDVYIVNIKKIKEKVKASMGDLKHAIEKGQLNTLEKKLTEPVHEQINQIKKYLERYRGDLMQGVEDQKLDSEKKITTLKS